MQPERRFEGTMSADYLVIRSALPNFEELQRLVAEEVAAGPAPARVLDLGCGDGATSGSILSRCPGVQITALDSEAAMVRQASENLAGAVHEGRCRVVLADALEYLRGQPEGSFDVMASALALHNLAGDYRHAVHEAIYRVLAPGGRFVNADKYAADDEQRFERLRRTLTAFFDVFVPLGRLDLLREAVLHEVADEAPGRLMREEDTLHELTAIGFCDIAVRRRLPMATLLVAHRKA